MASSTNHAFSTWDSDAEAERCNEENQQSITITSLPIIDLPHRWDENGALLEGSSPARCDRCLWNGDPKYLLKKEPGREHGNVPGICGSECQAGPFDCGRCELMRLLLLKLARDVGLARLDTIMMEIHDGNIVCIEDAEDTAGTSFYREIFISYDSQSSNIDQYEITRRRMVSTGTQWASDLISKCTSFHEKCNAQIDHEYLPTRLIRIQPNEKGDTPRLSLQNSRAVPPGSQYVALSYCWGDYKPACMTTQFDDKDSIPLEWSDLPRTFQDAATFTLHLGIEFLWIDSICIIQGDSKDWNHEAPKMNAVYKNSYVTLAGLCGYDSRNGLRTISMKETSRPIVQLQTAQATHVLYSRMCHYLDTEIRENADSISRHCCPYPLLNRAWTYQERIVSSRVIFFTESEMIYQCRYHVTCECGSSRDYYGDNSETISRLNKSEIWSATTRTPDLGPDCPRSSISQTLCRDVARIWRENVVREYSKLIVSEIRDRLPAVGALAKQFQDARPHEEYLAGLWSGTLLEDLLWVCTRDPFNKQDLNNNENLARYDGLPTWTWASVRGAVEYYLPFPDVHKARFKVHCKYTNDEKFGTLENSRLELEGRILVCILDEGPLRPELSFQNGHVLEGIDNFDGDFFRVSRIYMDRDQEELHCKPREKTVHLMEILHRSGLNQTFAEIEWCFLLLHLEDNSQERTSGVQAYTRGGVVVIVEGRLNEAIDNTPSPEGSSPEKSSFEKLRPDDLETLLSKHGELTTCEIR